jgi:hypothetical protein
MSRRFENNNGSRCLMSVDGTDFMTFEPGAAFDPKWLSYKTNGPGLRYEIGVCIQTGCIVWINGPFPAGGWNDIRISRDSLIYELEPWELVISDGGYGGQYHLQPDPAAKASRCPFERMKAKVRARHETINRLFKVFNCLRNEWRHDFLLHNRTFWVVAHLVQFGIEYEGTVFQVMYDDRPYLPQTAPTH